MKAVWLKTAALALAGVFLFAEDLPAAWGGFFQEKGIRDAVDGLAKSFEKQDIDGLRMRMAEEFLQGNPEVLGRLADSFEKFENITLTYKIASLQVHDSIVAVRLNWTKTCTDKMSNWTYRDIGKDVVMYFSAVPPYQLVGLEEANLFGVSFLLQARIVITAPALAKLELDRKKLELEERRLALEEEQREQDRLKAARAQLRQRAKEEVRAHRERTPAATTAAPPSAVTGAAAPGATAVAPSAAPPQIAAAPVSPAIGQKTPPPPAPAVPAPPPAPLWPTSPPPAVAAVRASVATQTTPEELVAGVELSEEVRRKAEEEALALLERRRYIAPATGAVAAAAALPAAPPVVPAVPPEVEEWRQAALRELRAPPPAPLVSNVPQLAPEAAWLRSESIAEARRRAVARAQRLSADSNAAASSVMADIQRRALERAEVLSNAPAAAAPITNVPNLRAVEEAVKMEAEVRQKADAEAQRLLQRRLPSVPTGAVLAADGPPAKSAVSGEEDMAREVRERAEQEARRLLALRAAAERSAVAPPVDVRTVAVVSAAAAITGAVAAPPPVQNDDFAPTGAVAAVPQQDEQPSSAAAASFIKTVVATTAPPPAVTAAPPASLGLLPELCLVKGGSQPAGPQHDFYFGKYEVTNEEFCRFLNALRLAKGRGMSAVYFDEHGNIYMNEARESQHKLFSMSNLDFGGRQTGIKLENGEYLPVPGRERHPVVGVSWFGAVKYCNWLTLVSGLDPTNICYSEGEQPAAWHPVTLTDQQWADGFSLEERRFWLEQCGGFRLPMNEYNTSAGPYNEFYLAAAWNGSRNVLYGFGRDTVSGADANFFNSGYPPENGTTPVGFYDGSNHNGAFATNPNENYFGIFDLSGNVWEWATDTTGNPAYRALYGGSWRSDMDGIKTSYRGSIAPYNTADHVGFRVAIRQPPTPAK